MSREIITIRAAPLAPISSLNQSSETCSQVTGEALHSTALCFPPLPSNSSLPDADNFAEFICDQRCSWFFFEQLRTVKSPGNPESRSVRVALTLTLLNVELCSGLVAELALVGCRRRASLRTLMDLVSQSSQRGFSAVRGRFLPVRHHLTARPHNPRLLFPQ